MRPSRGIDQSATGSTIGHKCAGEVSGAVLGVAAKSARTLFHDHSIEFVPATVSGDAAIAYAYAAMPALLALGHRHADRPPIRPRRRVDATKENQR
ncbi:hypothetical protein ACFV23_07050 [Streptomyces sp. NPDC059627]